jgi:hypothetical protein
VRIVFDQAETEGLSDAARHAATGDPLLAFVLLDLAGRGFDLEGCRIWSDMRVELGLAGDAQECSVA